jgi:hypothetical protein
MSNNQYFGLETYFNEKATFYKGVEGDVTGNVSGNVSGDVTGNVTGNLTGNVSGDVTGNVTGNLTGNVNSSGISTFSDVVVGGATTELIVNGDTRITGILTVGESSVTINGNTNIISGVSSVTDFSGGYLTIPPGAVQFFLRNTAPNGWIKANGATISRSAYSDLFDAIGTTFGAGDGSTTFAIPDLRGEFLRSWDDSRGIDSGRGFGSAQGFGIPRMIGGVADSHGLCAMQPIDVGGFTNPFYGSGTSLYRTTLQTVNTNFQVVYFDSARIIAASPDVRPRNIALLACIKY